MLSSTQLHILVVDDEPESIASLMSTLREQNWRVSLAKGGHQGFHYAQTLMPDLILLDVLMPRINGLAACRLLKESPRTRDIPIIFLTAASDGDSRLAGLQSGGVDYVVKPCLPAEVVVRIGIHLRRTMLPAASPMPESTALLSNDEAILRAAMRLIAENLAGLPSLAEIAHQVGTYDKRLSAVFYQHLGMSVFAWIREERLRLARQWLAETHMNIQDIAAQIGFHSAANFATAFRARVGVTPSQYRDGLKRDDRDKGASNGAG